MIIPDVIEQFIDNLDYTLEIKSFSDDGTNTTIVVANTLHARDGLIVNIDGMDYTIISVDHSTCEIVVEGVLVDPQVMTLQKPFFFHGTPYATNAHISYLNDASKVPMVYLLEIIKETIDGAADRLFATTAEMIMFFLDVANFQDWDTDEHYSNVIVPQRNFVEYFMYNVRQSGLFGDVSEWNITTHVKFGVYVDNKGHLNSLFNDRLSGLELRFDLPFVRNLKCLNK